MSREIVKVGRAEVVTALEIRARALLLQEIARVGARRENIKVFSKYLIFLETALRWDCPEMNT